MDIQIKKRGHQLVLLDTTFLNDTSLTWKAKGLMAYLLSKPDDWRIIVDDLIDKSKDNEAAVRSGINELISKGYIHKVKIRDDLGKFVLHNYILCEIPVSLKSISRGERTEEDVLEAIQTTTLFPTNGKSRSGETEVDTSVLDERVVGIYNLWNSKGLNVIPKLTKPLIRYLKKVIYGDDRQITEIYEVIDNYYQILKSKEHWWTYELTLEQLLSNKMYNKFLSKDGYNPFEEYVKGSRKSSFKPKDDLDWMPRE